jgi:hypothetical protein
MAEKPKGKIRVTSIKGNVNIGGVRKPKAPPSEFDKYKVAIINSSMR